MKKTTRKGFNKKVKQIKEGLKSIGYKTITGISLVALLTACGADSDVSKKLKEYEDAKMELQDAQEDLKKEQEDLVKAQERVNKAIFDEMQKKAEFQKVSQKL